MITVVARVIRDEFSGKEGAKVWSVKSINRPYKEVESCDKRRRRQRMDLTRSQRNALFAFFERVNNSSSIFRSRHVHVYIFWKIEDWKCSSGMRRDSNFLSQNVDREKYIYLFGKKDWKIEGEKIWIGEKNNRRGRICLGISIRLGEKFVGKNRTNVWGFSTERQTSCWERQMSREVGDRSTRKRSRRGRKRKRKPRSKQSGHYSRPTADGAAYKISRITNSCLSFSLFLYETGQSRILANCFNYF